MYIPEMRYIDSYFGRFSMIYAYLCQFKSKNVNVNLILS